MRFIKFLIIAVTIFALLNIRLTVQGLEVAAPEETINYTQAKYDIKETVRGSIEDEAWMKSRSREEVHSSLGRYFTGFLLEDLSDRSWAFVSEHTDWYCRAKLVDMAFIYDDGSRVVLEALIGIDDLENGHTEFGRGLYGLIKTEGGWKINYSAFDWNNGDE
ncbi:MAG: hypothetical protein ACOY46_11760 [Bacillota bacterium]